MVCEICSCILDSRINGEYIKLKEGTIVCRKCAKDIVNHSQQLMVYRRPHPEVFFHMDKFLQKQHNQATKAQNTLLQLVEKLH